METILGKPVSSLARHGGSYCPQLLTTLGRRGLPYVYSPARLPGHHVTWFCNTLNFFECMTVFQEAYLSRDAFLRAEKEFFGAQGEQRIRMGRAFQLAPVHDQNKGILGP